MASAQAAVAKVEVVVAVRKQLAGGGAVVTRELAVVRAASAES